MGASLLVSYMHATESMSRNLVIAGLDKNCANSLSYLVSDTVFADIAAHTSQQLVSFGLAPTNSFELRRFFRYQVITK